MNYIDSKYHLLFKSCSSRKLSQKEPGSALSGGLPPSAHSQVRSRYCATRGLWPAEFPPWAGASLFRRPGRPKFASDAHIDAGLSADTRSTWRAWRAGPPPSRRPPTQASRKRDYRSAPPLPARTKEILRYITHLRNNVACLVSS